MENNQLLENTLNKLLSPKKENILTGFNDLDSILAGINKGNLITIGGRPAMGKSSLLMSIFENVLKAEKRCLYCSLDMSEEQFLKRLFIQYAELNNTMVNIDNISDKDKELLNKTMEDLKTFEFKLNCNSLTINDIEDDITQYKPDYVFIDYIQLIKIGAKKEMQNEMKNILKHLKNIANEYGCYIFITSQLSRALEARVDKRPLLCDLREAGAIEEVSDVVMFIYRESYYRSRDEIINPETAEIIVAKNKFGPVGTVFLLFKGEILKFCSPFKTNKF